MPIYFFQSPSILSPPHITLTLLRSIPTPASTMNTSSTVDTENDSGLSNISSRDLRRADLASLTASHKTVVEKKQKVLNEGEKDLAATQAEQAEEVTALKQEHSQAEERESADLEQKVRQAEKKASEFSAADKQIRVF